MRKIGNKGFAKGLSIAGIISGVILLVLAFNVIAVGVPEIQTAGDVVNATGAPFATFFASDGLMVLAVMGAVVLGVVGYLGLTKKGR